MEKLRDSVTFAPDSSKHVQTLKTALTLQWACELGEETCLEEANELFNEYMEGTR